MEALTVVQRRCLINQYSMLDTNITVGHERCTFKQEKTRVNDE